MGQSQDGNEPAERHPLISRRQLVVGGAATAGVVVLGGAAVEQGFVPGRSWVHRRLGLDAPAGKIPEVQPGRSVSGSFVSAARLGAACGWTIAYPPDAGAGLPVLVVLHAYGADHTSVFGDHLGLDRFLAQAVNDGASPFAIASVDGGDTYWHPRASGEDSGAMVIDEFLPLLGRHGLDTAVIGLFGWSMGGYGVLRLAAELGAQRVFAVVAESPALWLDADDTAPGAFDDAADYTRHTVFGRQAALVGIPLRIDCGTDDRFYAATVDYVASLTPRPAGSFEPGGHDTDYWRRMAPEQLDFIASHLPAGA